MVKLLPPGLHVILGDSAGGTFTRVFFARDRLLIDHDVLSCGPTPLFNDLEAWRKLRADFWAGLVPGSAGEPAASSFNLIENAARLADAERIHVWAGSGVSEQLFIAFVVHLTQFVGGDVERIWLVQFEGVGRRSGDRVIGLGELDEAQLRAHPTPTRMSMDVAQDYLDAWAALTSPDPISLAAYPREHPHASRWLKLAMQLMTRRFPDKRHGMCYWDHALLSRVPTRGPEASRIIGYTMSETFVLGDLVGDWFLFGRLLRMASDRNPQPLIALSGDSTSIPGSEAKLTPFGEQVLKGEASNYPVNPIDDWAAGVRLTSDDGHVWFNDGGKLIHA